MRLSTRIALAVGVLVPLLVLASGWIMVRLVGRDVHSAADAHLRQRAAAVRTDARNLLRAEANDRPPSVEQARQRKLLNAALDVGIRVTGTGGTLLAEGPQPGATVTLPSAAAAARPVTVADGARSWRVLAVPVAGTRPAASGTLWLFSPDAAGQAQIHQVRRRVLTVALVTAPVAGAAAWLLAAGLSRPLLALRRRAAGIDPRVSPARLEHTPTRVPEVDDLAGTLRTVLARYDEQAARTAEALDTARSFSAAASHELRTPLMSMRINLDVLDGDPPPAPAERAEIVADLRAEHERLLGLLVMLRSLAAGDLVEADAFAPVDLGELLENAAAAARRERPGVLIATDAAPGCVVRGWPPGLRSLVDNLLANAAVHGAGPDGTARVEAVLRPGAPAGRGAGPAGGGPAPGRAPGPAGAPATVRLTVADHGPGVPPGARQEIFRRFHRRPGSPGSGLGLTLVAQQAALHGGRITVCGRPDGTGGAHITVELPCEPPSPALPGPRTWLVPPPQQGGGGPQGFHKEDP